MNPWIAIIIAAVVLTIVLLVRANRSFRSHVRHEFIAYLREHHPELVVTEHTDRLQIGPAGREPGTLFLHNLYGQIADVRLADADAVRQVYERFAGLVVQGLAASPPDPQRDRARVFPRLVPAEFFQSPEVSGIQVPHRPLHGTGLYVAYVLDSKDSMAYVTRETMEQLRLDADSIHDLALQNLRQRFSRDAVRSAVDKHNLVAVKSGDGYDAARLLLVPEHLEDGEVLAAAIPDRDTLVLAPAPKDGNWTAIRRLSATPAGPPLLSRPLAVSRDGIAVKT